MRVWCVPFLPSLRTQKDIHKITQTSLPKLAEELRVDKKKYRVLMVVWFREGTECPLSFSFSLPYISILLHTLRGTFKMQDALKDAHILTKRSQ